MLRKTKKEVNPFEINLLGGEPFVRKDVIDVLNLSNELFRKFGVFTNGTLLHKLDCASLKELKSLSNKGNIITITLDSKNPAINDKTRGLTTDTLKGLRALENEGIDFSVGSVCTKINVNSFEGTMKYLLGNFKHFVGMKFNYLEPTPTLGLKYLELAVNEDKITKAKLKFENLRKELQREDAVILARDKQLVRESVFNKYNLKICDAGATMAAVLADGSVVPCLLMRSVRLGNLHNESWRSICKKTSNNYKKLIDMRVEGRKCNQVDVKTPALCCYSFSSIFK
jgi:MoaA/NifB/PqqE/SkfB family radical SAM enzyme